MSHRQETVPNRPETRVFRARFEVLKEAVERVLVKKNYSLDTEGSTPNHIQTEWLEEGRYRTTVRADLKSLDRNRTELTIQVLLEKKSLFGDNWESMDEIGMDVYSQLMGDVEMESYRVLYDGG